MLTLLNKSCMPETEQLKAKRVVDWPPIREAYITRSPLPSYTELSEEFPVSTQSISRCANEEGWAEMRLARIQGQLVKAGASELILESIKDEGKLLQSSRLTASNAVEAANLIIERITLNSDETKDSTRATTLNNVCFALANLGRFIESIGIVGMAGRIKGAKQAGESSDGQPWEKGMLQQINVTVKNIQAEAERAKPVAEVTGSTEPSGPAKEF